MYISKKQLSLLSQIAKKSVVRTDPLDVEDIEYLLDNGLVSVTKYEKPEDYFYQPRITEKGKAFLYEKIAANRKANLSLALSVFAILLSLLTALTPFADWCKIWISAIFPGIS